MPLPKHIVDPVYVARKTVSQAESYGGIGSIPNELEVVTNGTLANTIRQLSSLSKQAENMFGSILSETNSFTVRVNLLKIRLDRLSVSRKQSENTDEKISLQDNYTRKAFKSAVVFDQQVLSRDTMPVSMFEMYSQCDKPPPLYKFNPYREDDKDSMKFYTNPDYFFNPWRLEMLKDTEAIMYTIGKKLQRPKAEEIGGRHKKRVRQPHSTRERQTLLAIQHGEIIMPQDNYRASHQLTQQNNYQNPGSMDKVKSPLVALCRVSRGSIIRPSKPPPAPPSIYNSNNSALAVLLGSTPTRGYSLSSIHETLPPPPSPPIENNLPFTKPLPTPPSIENNLIFTELLPSPSPPVPISTPLPSINILPSLPLLAMPDPSTLLANGNVKFSPNQQKSPLVPIINSKSLVLPNNSNEVVQLNDVINDLNTTVISISSGTSSSLSKTPEIDDNIHNDSHSDLLKAIRDGVELRKVEKIKEEGGELSHTLHNVASILARRMAIEISDSDSASGTEYDSDGWDEDTSA